MNTNNSKCERQFDLLLKKALAEHEEPARNDFTNKMLKRIDDLEQQRILAKVIFQKRLALVGCIILPIASLALILFSPQVVIDFSAWMLNQYDTISQNLLKLGNEWHLQVVVSVGLAVTIYGLFDTEYYNL